MTDSNRGAALIPKLVQEKKDAVLQGETPIKWLIHTDLVAEVIDAARAQGVLSEDGLARILGLPVMMGRTLITLEEGTRIVCEGDVTHNAILALYEAARAA